MKFNVQFPDELDKETCEKIKELLPSASPLFQYDRYVILYSAAVLGSYKLFNICITFALAGWQKMCLKFNLKILKEMKILEEIETRTMMMIIITTLVYNVHTNNVHCVYQYCTMYNTMYTVYILLGLFLLTE